METLLASGETIDATQAAARGLAEWVVAALKLSERAFERAARLARRPPMALRSQLSLIDHAAGDRLRLAMQREMEAQLILFDGKEFADVRRTGFAAASWSQGGRQPASIDFLDMERVPEAAQGRLLEAFPEGRMSVDRAGDIVQRRAHLDGKTEGGRQLRDALSHRLDPEHQP